MIGTAIQSQPVFQPAASSARTRRRPAARSNSTTWMGWVLSRARFVVSALVLCAYLVGSSICAPGEHENLSKDEAVAAQSLSSDAVSFAQADKAPANKQGPAKSKVTEICSGHCSAHFVSLPTQFVQAEVPFEIRGVWAISSDTQTTASSSDRLDRPPRA